MLGYLWISAHRLANQGVIMKEIIARVYFIYMAILFAFTMIWVAIVILLLKLFLNENQFPSALHKTYKIWMAIYMPLILCPVRRYGLEKFRKDKNYIVVINHSSFMDIPVSSPGIPVATKTLAKAELKKIPIFGYIYSQGSILVDRSDRKSRYESFQQMKDVLSRGLSLCLYPEGTRNKSSAPLSSFKDGAFRLALSTQTDIIPAVILGTKNILHPTKKMYAWPHKIAFHFLDVVQVKNYENADVLKDEVRNSMLSFIMQNQPV